MDLETSSRLSPASESTLLSEKGRQPPILLIDSRSLERECLRYCLVAAGYSTTAIARFDAAQHAGLLAPTTLVLVFHDAAGGKVGGEVLELLAHPEQGPVLVMSSVERLDFAVDVIRRGARGYIPTSSSVHDVLGAIQLVNAGSVYIPASCVLSEKAQAPQPAEEQPTRGGLTAKQAAVVERVRLGKPNKIIAYELNMCESTVKVHIRNIMKKLKARNRTELAFKATQIAESALKPEVAQLSETSSIDTTVERLDRRITVPTPGAAGTW